ncbi:peptidase U4 sporulation factor SpoIIGA [Thermaerobacter marianensis DSM 12885]|uniref:Peptidase U4 sporulation factor SpoIIGA n=1 Tax=Thermaerobacter marianensis (strain ATCC 700841 / DSM 12885 / JCM 10246 / 7p75a) TaxID=644966 RepID=E6SIZ2_THEM7|nr:sigma-E processing peptidase SpoIIGA [Thermaerobacter marianensis]ADU50987.1 peptidase U4 sporulation factor SpoIIGA [Thermaerobacter marianensis DSM 12885]
MPYVYLDIFVLVNAVVDYALLAATAQATQARTSRWRLLLATAWGTAFACAAALFPAGPWRGLPAVLLASALMLLLAFWPVTPRRLLALAAWFYGLACFVAGGAMAVLSLAAGRGLPAGAPALALVPAVAAVLATGRYFWQAWRRRSLPGPLYVTLRVACEGRSLDLPALVDTGNQLRDPLTGLAVVVVEEQAVAPLLPPGLRQAVAAGDDIAAWARAATACGWADRLRIVPFASIGRERGFLAGFRPDALWLQVAGHGNAAGVRGAAEEPRRSGTPAAPAEAGAGQLEAAAAAIDPIEAQDPARGPWRALGPAVVAVFPGRFTGDQHYVALLPTALLEAPPAAHGAAARVS